MVIQAFCDESETFAASTRRHFVMACLVGESPDWTDFSDQWQVCLKNEPCVEYFKMSEAAALGGQFYKVKRSARDAKLADLANIINKYASMILWSVFDLDAVARVRSVGPRSTRNNYFWPFQNTINSVCFALWDAGPREKFEIIFDEQVIFGPRAKRWYPVMRDIVTKMHPEEARILPVAPHFGNDMKFLPLQAADLFAWCIRSATDDPDRAADFAWLLPLMPNVKTTEYSQYFNEERLLNLRGMTTDAVRRADPIAQEISLRYKNMFKS